MPRFRWDQIQPLPLELSGHQACQQGRRMDGEGLERTLSQTCLAIFQEAISIIAAPSSLGAADKIKG